MNMYNFYRVPYHVPFFTNELFPRFFYYQDPEGSLNHFIVLYNNLIKNYSLLTANVSENS